MNVRVTFTIAAVLVLSGCTKQWQQMYVYGCDRDIAKAAAAIESARDTAQRAAGYSLRGKAYSEKARYSRLFKLISADEFNRLFGLAIKDHEQAVTLNPAAADLYYDRGYTYYQRGTVEDPKDAAQWYEKAATDFSKAVEKNSRYDQAWDMLGLVYESAGHMDEAIDAYTKEMALVPLGRARLVDAYCVRGSKRQGDKKDLDAIADYEKSVEFGVSDDGCACDPYNPLVGLYDANHQYDKGWDVVHKARKSKHYIAPELVASLQKNSGRTD